MRYLKFKKHKKSKLKSIVLRIKPRKYSKKCKEQYISKKKHILIFGLEASGKTKELHKIIKAKENLFKEQHLILNGKDSFSIWYQTNIKAKDIKNMLENIEDEEEKEEISSNIKTQHIKIHTLINKAQNAIVFIDDIDNLQGKKLEIAKDIIRVSKLVVATAKEEQTINKTILYLLKKKSYNKVELTTQSSYDATNLLFVMFIIAMLTTGQYELAIMIMAGRYALKGVQK